MRGDDAAAILNHPPLPDLRRGLRLAFFHRRLFYVCRYKIEWAIARTLYLAKCSWAEKASFL
jgi:hypothetical protein